MANLKEELTNFVVDCSSPLNENRETLCPAVPHLFCEAKRHGHACSTCAGADVNSRGRVGFEDWQCRMFGIHPVPVL